MKDSKRKSKPSKKLPKRTPDLHSRHDAVWYGIMKRGRLIGGISTPELYSLKDVTEWIEWQLDPKPYKVVKIRVTHEVIAEVTL